MKAKVKAVGNLKDKIEAIARRSRDMRAFLNSTVFNMYKDAQVKRWQTENVSEGQKWKPLASWYKEYKLKRFDKFPGGGRKLLIATGLLSRSAIGQDSSGFRKVVTPRKLVISLSKTKIPYAEDVAESRPVMKFGKNTKAKIKKAMLQYIMTGKVIRGGV